MRSFFVNVDERVWSWGVLVRRTSRPTYWGDVCWKGRGWEHMIMYCTFAWRGWGNSAYPTWWPVIGEDSRVHLRHRSGPLGLDFWKRRNKSRSGKLKLRTGGRGRGAELIEKFHTIGDSSLPNTWLKQDGLQLAQASFRHKPSRKRKGFGMHGLPAAALQRCQPTKMRCIDVGSLSYSTHQSQAQILSEPFSSSLAGPWTGFNRRCSAVSKATAGGSKVRSSCWACPSSALELKSKT